jgi:1,4-dihydroxy-2-naphthoate octaprenyltransferase
LAGLYFIEIGKNAANDLVDYLSLWLLTFVSLPLAVRAVRTAASALDNIPEFIGANVNTFYIYQLTGLFMLVSALLCSRF